MSSGAPSDCFTAQTTPFILDNGPVNLDIGGLVVKLAAIINNLLLSILLRWSDGSYLEAVYGHYSQIFPILLATVASIPGKLSVFEGNLALVITASPISIYLSCLAYYRTYQDPKSTLKFADQTGHVFARWLGLLLPFLWWSLNFVVSFSTTAFRNSRNCKGMTISMWIHHVITSSFVGIFDVMGARDLYVDFSSRGSLGTASLITLWAWSIYFVRHLDDIWELHQSETVAETAKRRAIPLRWIVATLRFIRISWSVISTSHGWLVTITICCFHWHWLLCVIKGTPMQNYDLSYGQILAGFSVFPAIVGVVKLVASRYKTYRSQKAEKQATDSLSSRWSKFQSGITFFVIGKPCLPSLHSSTSLSESLRPAHLPSFLDLGRSRSRLTYIIFPLLSLLASSLHAGYIMFYVIAGTSPTEKNFMNANHALWKPLSVTLYVLGFLIGWFNAYIWSFYPDLCGRILQRLRLLSSIPERYKRIFCITNITIIIPVAILMCLGPLFSPFAALPLTQEHQWRYRCKDLEFPAEAILDGNSLSFAIYNSSGQPISILPYMLTGSENTWSMMLNASDYPSDIYAVSSQTPLEIAWNNGRIDATCGSEICLQGNYTTLNNLSLQFHTMGADTSLATEEDQWSYPNDAPSFILRRPHPSNAIVMETAVTRRNHCQELKICLSAYPVDLDVFATLGLVMIYQHRYAKFCMPAKLSSSTRLAESRDGLSSCSQD